MHAGITHLGILIVTLKNCWFCFWRKQESNLWKCEVQLLYDIFSRKVHKIVNCWTLDLENEINVEKNFSSYLCFRDFFCRPWKSKLDADQEKHTNLWRSKSQFWADYWRAKSTSRQISVDCGIDVHGNPTFFILLRRNIDFHNIRNFWWKTWTLQGMQKIILSIFIL